MIIRKEVIVSEPPKIPRKMGPYNLVAVGRPLSGGPPELTWFDQENGGVVREEICQPRPFGLIIFDLDGTVVNSEGPNGYFAFCWLTFLRQAGIEGTDSELHTFHRLAYTWNGDLLTSTTGMLNRIRKNPQLTPMKKLLEYSPEDIAFQKEAIGQEMLEKDPARVLQLAPLMPGVEEFIRAIFPEIPLAIASSSRVQTILSILQAHARLGNDLLQRFNGLIFGEGGYWVPKPERRFYESAILGVGQELHRRGQIPPYLAAADALYIGNAIAQMPQPDLPLTRRGMHHIVLQPTINPDALGPLAAVVPDFPTLMETIRKPQQEITNSTLQRLKLTLSTLPHQDLR